MASKDLLPRSSLGSELTMVLVGQERVGKSASGNTILGRLEFESKLSFRPVTLKCQKGEGVVCDKRLKVVDTPGLFNSELSKSEVDAEFEEALRLSSPGPHAFLLVLQLGRFSEQENKVMETLEKMMCPSISDHTLVLFTYGDRLSGTDIEHFIREDKNLEKLVQKCGWRYHVFNNHDAGNIQQVKELLDKIDDMTERGQLRYLRYSCRSKKSGLISRMKQLVQVISTVKGLLLLAGTTTALGTIYYITR
ncbi:GTPase IMAP family member 2-like [Lampris incognitus]|uniref:GTPase IMAP family member 2-like n=1 Tax=Lampris incognitus TaxID=2546036 RepID=UPI0024B51D2D|nr:GTPase IMAP family member 2-like [Lampris incognitus]